MTNDQVGVRDLLKQLAPNEFSWEVKVPAAFGAFFGHPLLLTIGTEWLANRSGPTPASPSELSLAELILSELPAIVRQAECQFREYNRDESAPERHVRDPHLWIDRFTYADEAPLRWAMVVHHDEWPDYGWHIEFEGIRSLEIWAGS